MAEDNDDVQCIGVKYGEMSESTREEMAESGIVWSGSQVRPLPPMASIQMRNRISMYANKVARFYMDVAGHAGLKLHEVVQSPVGLLSPFETAGPPSYSQVKEENPPDVWEAAFMELVKRLGEQPKGGLSEGARTAIWLTQPEVTGTMVLQETTRAKTNEALAELRKESGIPDVTFEQAALESDEEVRTVFALSIAHSIMYAKATRPGTSALRQTANIHANEVRKAWSKFRNVVRLDDKLCMCSRDEALRRQKQRVDEVVRNIAPRVPVGVGAYRAVPLTAVL